MLWGEEGVDSTECSRQPLEGDAFKNCDGLPGADGYRVDGSFQPQQPIVGDPFKNCEGFPDDVAAAAATKTDAAALRCITDAKAEEGVDTPELLLPLEGDAFKNCEGLSGGDGCCDADSSFQPQQPLAGEPFKNAAAAGHPDAAAKRALMTSAPAQGAATTAMSALWRRRSAAARPLSEPQGVKVLGRRGDELARRSTLALAAARSSANTARAVTAVGWGAIVHRAPNGPSSRFDRSAGWPSGESRRAVLPDWPPMTGGPFASPHCRSPSRRRSALRSFTEASLARCLPCESMARQAFACVTVLGAAVALQPPEV